MNNSAIEKVEYKPIMVWLDDVNDYVEVSPERQERALSALKLLHHIELVKAFVIKMIHDEKLYAGLGCSSFRDFCERKLSFGKTKAYKYLKIANAFLPRFKGILVDGKISSEKLNNLSRVSSTEDKLSSTEDKTDNDEYILLGMPFRDLVRSAEEIDFEEIDREGTGKLAEQLHKIKDKSASKISQLTEELKTVKSERDIYKNDLIAFKGRIEHAEELERLYGARASKLEEKRICMDKAREHLAMADQYFHQINIAEDDPDALQKDVVDLCRRFNSSFIKSKNAYTFLWDLIEEYE